MKVPFSSSGQKPVERWNCLDIFNYFRSQWKENTGKNLRVQGAEIIGFLTRISQFKKRTGLTSQQYKEFIEGFFQMVAEERWEVTFGCIVSSKVYEKVQEFRAFRHDYGKERAQVYQSSVLFKGIP